MRPIGTGKPQQRPAALRALLSVLLAAVLLVMPLASCSRDNQPTSRTTASSESTTAMASSASSSSTGSPTDPTTTRSTAPPTSPASTVSPTTTPTSTIPPRPVKTVSDGYRNFYEIFVRSFYDSDGDGLGDLTGVTASLDYVVDTLGADGIWLMPICPSPTYHKYDVTNYLAIDPEYGTLADFDRLITEAHKRDVRVIVDLVLNHTSNLHPWFDKAVQALWTGQKSPYIQYYHFTTENLGQGYAKITDKYYYECRFVSGMPDLNLDNPAVREEIRKITQFWLDRGADGFRLDAVTSFYTGVKDKNIDFLTWLNQTVKTQKPDAYLIGEAWSDRLTIADYYASGIDSFFNFPYSQVEGQLVDALNGRSGQTFAEALSRWNQLIKGKNPKAKDALFLSNHDQGRSAGFLLRNPQKQKMAAALYLLAPGNPFIYYGEELGMTGSGVDPNKRLPMIWSESDRTGLTHPPPGSTQVISEVKGADVQARDPNSLLRFYRQVLDIKIRYPEIARGTMDWADTGVAGVAAFTLTYQGKTVAILHNLAEEMVKIDLQKLGWGGVRLVDTLVAGGPVKPQMIGQELVMPTMTTSIVVLGTVSAKPP